ncbi:MAG: phage tail protein I [Kiritimatiellales bacterium]
MAVDRSILPGAPHPDSGRQPTGIFAMDIAVRNAMQIDSSPLTLMTDPDTCPADVLPFLAWAYSVDEWPAGVTEEEKRALIKASIAVHKNKGTPHSIKAVLAAAGYGNATIRKGEDLSRYDGAVAYDGSISYGVEWNWALWSVILEKSDPIPSDALISLLIRTAPGRCKLISIGYEKLFFRYNGTFSYDGTRNYINVYTEA